MGMQGRMLCVVAMLMLLSPLHAVASEPMRRLPILGGDESMQAARRALDLRDYEALGRVVAESPGVGNRLFENGVSLLNYAANYGDVVVVRLLLKEGADPNVGRNVGNASLYGLLLGISKFDAGNGYSGVERTDFFKILVMLIQYGARYNEFYKGRGVLSPDEDISTIMHIVMNFCQTKGGSLRYGYEESDLNPLRESSVVFRIGRIQAFQVAAVEYYSMVGIFDYECVRSFVERVEIAD